MSLFKKKLMVGRRIAVIAYGLGSRCAEFRIGKIVAKREDKEDVIYAVRFDDGKIDLFNARQLFTEWGEEAK